MASTIEEFETDGWTLLRTDEFGKEIRDELPRRRRRGNKNVREFITLLRRDGLKLRPGSTIICAEEGKNASSVYMIHEIRLNTNNFIELWCLNYLNWYEINPAEYFKRFDSEFYENNKDQKEPFFVENFQRKINKKEIYLTAEVSEVSLKQIRSCAKIQDQLECDLSEGMNDELDNKFLCRYACLPSGTNLTELLIHDYENRVLFDEPKVSLGYLRDLTVPKHSKAFVKPKTPRKSVSSTSLSNKVKFEGLNSRDSNVKDRSSNNNSKESEAHNIPQKSRADNDYVAGYKASEKNISCPEMNNVDTNEYDGCVHDLKKLSNESQENLHEQSAVSRSASIDNFMTAKFAQDTDISADESNGQNSCTNKDGHYDEDDDEDDDFFESAEEFEEDQRPTKHPKLTSPTKASPTKIQTPSSQSSPRKTTKRTVVRAKRAYTSFSKRYKNPDDIPDLKDIFHQDSTTIDVAALEDKFRAPSAKGRVETIFSKVKKQLNSRQIKENIVNSTNFENYLPARENEFANIYLSVYSAIESGSSTTVYIAGTPGVGKTLTVREVIKDLLSSAEQKELPKFQYIEINGLKMVKPSDSYEILWDRISGERLTSAAALESLDFYFNKVPLNKKRPVVIMLDELDALVTKKQDLMYNFFNWATYENAKLVVIAVANTMDLPERHLGNKVSSRIGFTRIMFTGYTYEELKTIINLRLQNLNDSCFFVDPITGSSHLFSNDTQDLPFNEIQNSTEPNFSNWLKVRLRISPDAIEIASRKIASVSGDARRALKVVKRAVEIAERDYMENRSSSTGNSGTNTATNGLIPNGEELQTVDISHITRALNETVQSPLAVFIGNLSFSGKLFLYALINLIKKEKKNETMLGDIVDEIKLLIDVNGQNKYVLELKRSLFQANAMDTKEQLRIISWDYIIGQLIEAGILTKQNLKNERFCPVRLNVSMEEVENSLSADEVFKNF